MGRRELMGINIWKLLLGDRSVRGFVLGRGGEKVIDSYKTDFFFLNQAIISFRKNNV